MHNYNLIIGHLLRYGYVAIDHIDEWGKFILFHVMETIAMHTSKMSAQLKASEFVNFVHVTLLM